LKTKDADKSKLASAFSSAEVNRVPISDKKFKGQGHRTSKTAENWRHVFLRAADEAQAGHAPTGN